MKRCPGCGQEFPLTAEHFHRNRAQRSGFSHLCKICKRKSDRRTRERNRLAGKTHRDKHLKHRYGLTEAEWDALVAIQEGQCAICGDAAEVLHVDHDHSCCSGRSCGKCLRALLCQRCNRGLGLFRDRPELLRRAADYILFFSQFRLDLQAADIPSIELFARP